MKISALEFIKYLKEQIHESEDSFILNTINSGIEGRTFCEWIDIFSAWMEWTDEEQCKEYYED